MCGYFCIRLIDYILKGKGLLDYTSLVSPNKYVKNDKIILKYFQKLKTKTIDSRYGWGKHKS